MYKDRVKRKKGFLGLIGGLIAAIGAGVAAKMTADSNEKIANQQARNAAYNSAVDKSLKLNEQMSGQMNNDVNTESLQEKSTIDATEEEMRCGGSKRRNRKDLGGWNSFKNNGGYGLANGFISGISSISNSFISNSSNQAVANANMQAQNAAKSAERFGNRSSIVDVTKDDLLKAKQVAKQLNSINSLDRIKQQQLFACGGRKRS